MPQEQPAKFPKFRRAFVYAAAATAPANALRLSGAITLSDTILLAALALTILTASLRSRLAGSIQLSLWVLTVAVLLSIYTSPTVTAIFTPAASVLLAFFVWPILVCSGLRGSWLTIAGLSQAWAIGVLFSAAVAVTDFLHVSALGLALTGLNFAGQRYSGLSVHPNHLALTSAMVLTFVLARGIKQAGAVTNKFATLGMCALLAAGILLGGSRAALVAAGLVAIFVLATRLSGFGRAWACLLVVGATLLVSSRPTTATSDSQLLVTLSRLSEAQAASDQGHVLLGENAWSVFLHSPLVGGGLGNLNSAHDIYLQVLASVGLLGATGFGLFMWVVMRAAATAYKRFPGSSAGAIFPSIGVWLLCGLFQNQVTDRYIMIPVAIAVALASDAEGQSFVARV